MTDEDFRALHVLLDMVCNPSNSIEDREADCVALLIFLVENGSAVSSELAVWERERSDPARGTAEQRAQAEREAFTRWKDARQRALHAIGIYNE